MAYEGDGDGVGFVGRYEGSAGERLRGREDYSV